MIRPPAKAQQRFGVAAVEMAVLLVPLMTLFLGVIELGRIIQVSQIVTEAAREGARAAAQGVTVQTIGNFIYYYASPSSPLAPNSTNTTPVYITDIVNQYLVTGGLTNVTGVNTVFQFTNPGNSNTDPWQGVRGDTFSVTVTVPYSNFRLTNIGWFNITSLTEKVNWGMLVDDPLVINPNVPNWMGITPPPG